MKKNIIIMCGLPASGKSTYAKKNFSDDKSIILSSDDIREKYFGDVNDQNHNEEVFKKINKLILFYVNDNNIQNIIFDATNINKKRRFYFINNLKNFFNKLHISSITDKLEFTCLLFATPYDICLSRNLERDRTIPDNAIKRMYLNFNPPSYSEGFDLIKIIYPDDLSLFSNFITDNFIDNVMNYDQKNYHHTLTLGEHSLSVFNYVKSKLPDVKILSSAAKLHDNGKPFTASFINGKGLVDNYMHYFQHQCVGAYNSLFYLKNDGFSDDLILDGANYIFFHMKRYIWNKSPKAFNRDRILMTDDFYSNLSVLQDGDSLAH